MALFIRTSKLDPEAHGARCTWATAIHHAVGISRQRNSGYRPSRVNHGTWFLHFPLLSHPKLALIHTSLTEEDCATTTLHYKQCYTTLVPSLGLHIGSACKAGLSAGMQKECAPPHRRKKTSLLYACNFHKFTIFQNCYLNAYIANTYWATSGKVLRSSDTKERRMVWLHSVAFYEAVTLRIERRMVWLHSVAF